MAPIMIAPSGEQFEITYDGSRCVITEVGATIRSYQDAAGDDILHPYDVTAMCDGGHGAPLIPWPNRIGDGRYEFDGETFQLALTEPSTSNANHGLLRWLPWRVAERSADRLTMAVRMHPVPGYPFVLDVELTFTLDADGLTVLTTAQNVGERACPYGAGHHPYLSTGAGATLDDCTVQLRAGTRLLTDPDRKLPVGTESVAGTAFDFRAPTTLRGLEVDHAFTDLERDSEGRSWVRLGRPDGRVVELWADETYRYVQLYTADTLAPKRRRAGLAAEPATCPPNAFQSGEDVRRLEPGESVTSVWGVRIS